MRRVTESHTLRAELSTYNLQLTTFNLSAVTFFYKGTKNQHTSTTLKATHQQISTSKSSPIFLPRIPTCHLPLATCHYCAVTFFLLRNKKSAPLDSAQGKNHQIKCSLILFPRHPHYQITKLSNHQIKSSMPSTNSDPCMATCSAHSQIYW